MSANYTETTPVLKLSVCLLSYNHAHVLSGAMESILRQTFLAFELLVSDDCSTDDSLQIIKNYADRDGRVRALQTPRNLGMPANANFAARHARGEYLAILHHDDILDSTLFQKWLQAADSDPMISFVFNDYLVNDQWLGHHAERFPLRQSLDGDVFLRRRLLKAWDCPVRGTALIRRDTFESAGGFDERFGLLADIDLWMRLARRAKVGYVPEPLIHVYRRHREGYPQAYTAFTWERWRQLFEIHAANLDRTLPKNGIQRLIAMASFRLRVSREVFKWMAYAIVKGRDDILAGVRHGVSVHELPCIDRLARALAGIALSLRRRRRHA